MIRARWSPWISTVPSLTAPPEPHRRFSSPATARRSPGGKTVTLVTGLPPGDLRAVAGELKRLCGSGGAVKEATVEIQGDHRARIIEHLAGRYSVRAAGG